MSVDLDAAFFLANGFCCCVFDAPLRTRSVDFFAAAAPAAVADFVEEEMSMGNLENICAGTIFSLFSLDGFDRVDDGGRTMVVVGLIVLLLLALERLVDCVEIRVVD